MLRQASFTLIELLIVIAIIAVLSVVVILALNPAELLKQARDSTRLTDIDTINRGIALLQTDSPSASLGATSTTYISLIDPAATTTAGTDCATTFGYPTSTYHCAASSTIRKVDSNGWLPANFQLISSGAPFPALPVDPINTSSSDLYYLYATNGVNWMVSALPESQKYKTSTASNVARFSKGTNTSLPTMGPVARWTFDEGSGNTVADSSGNNNNGTWQGTLGSQWTPGKVGVYAGNFNGTDNYVDTGYKVQAGARSVFFWIKYNTTSSPSGYMLTGTQEVGAYSYLGITNTGQGYSYVANGSGGGVYNYFFSAGQWYFIGFTADGINNIRLYVNGTQIDTKSYTGDNSAVTNFLIGRLTAGYYLNGLIDDVRIYNRALSAAEVSAIYNSPN